MAVALALAGATAGFTAARSPSDTIAISIRNSRFQPAHVTVRAGTPVRFVVTNGDPIAHEFVIGTPAEHRAHERAATEGHDGAPGQADLEIGETQVVPFVFPRPGTLEFACHVPGHFAYGMRGVIRVVA